MADDCADVGIQLAIVVSACTPICYQARIRHESPDSIARATFLIDPPPVQPPPDHLATRRSPTPSSTERFAGTRRTRTRASRTRFMSPAPTATSSLPSSDGSSADPNFPGGIAVTGAGAGQSVAARRQPGGHAPGHADGPGRFRRDAARRGGGQGHTVPLCASRPSRRAGLCLRQLRVQERPRKLVPDRRCRRRRQPADGNAGPRVRLGRVRLRTHRRRIRHRDRRRRCGPAEHVPARPGSCDRPDGYLLAPELDGSSADAGFADGIGVLALAPAKALPLGVNLAGNRRSR